MNPIALKNIVAPQLDRAFDLAGELVRDSIFYKTESNPCTGLLTMAALYAPVKALCVDYHSQDLDGSAVLVGDEKCFIRAGELASMRGAAEPSIGMRAMSCRNALPITATMYLPPGTN